MKRLNLHRLSKHVSMRCPHCFGLLKESSEMIHYQTLIDHVCDPNEVYNIPERTIFVCNNCVEGIMIYFDSEGDLYTRSEFRKNYRHKYKYNMRRAIFSTYWLSDIDNKIERFFYKIEKIFKSKKNSQ